MQSELQRLAEIATEKLGKPPALGPCLFCSPNTGWSAWIHMRHYDDKLEAPSLAELQVLIENFMVPTPAQIYAQKLEDAYAYRDEHGL